MYANRKTKALPALSIRVGHRMRGDLFDDINKQTKWPAVGEGECVRDVHSCALSDLHTFVRVVTINQDVQCTGFCIMYANHFILTTAGAEGGSKKKGGKKKKKK